MISFVSDLVEEALESAVERRTRNFQDLVWDRPDREPGFELAVEFEIPETLLDRLPGDYRRFRYEIAVGEVEGDVRIQSERGLLTPTGRAVPRQHSLFPDPRVAPGTLLEGGGRPGRRTVLSKSAEGSASFNLETAPRPGKGWVTSIALGHHRSALATLPEAPDTFPVSTLVKRTFSESIKPLFLESRRMREASPPSRQRNGFAPDGSSLSWTADRLKSDRPELYEAWLNHVQTALPDLESVSVQVREEDRHAYLMLRYEAGLEVPSWMVSDGTLRLLALTLLAYLPESGSIYLLEEPENGVHPLSLDAIHDSLSSVYGCQVSVHQQHDAGCRLDAAAFLRPFASRFEHALVLFDREGCGSEAPREEIEEQVEGELRKNGWNSRARVIVIDPELETWIWAPSPRLARELGWGTSFRELRNWLAANGLWPADVPKPPDTKVAMVEAMCARPRPKSAATFGRLGREMSFQGCQDSAFGKLRGTLMEWFPLST